MSKQKSNPNTNEGEERRFNIFINAALLATSSQDVIRRLARYFGKQAKQIDETGTHSVESIFLDGNILHISDVADFGNSETQENYYDSDKY